MSNSSPTHPPVPTTPRAEPRTETVPAWHVGFLKLLPAIRRQSEIEFRHMPAEAREEAVQEVVASATVAYARLAWLGKEHVASASPLARFAAAQYRSGRRIGIRLNVRDITSVHCHRSKGVTLERLDRWHEEEECWREVLVEDRTCTPAELAASRIDFAGWMTHLSARNRRAARLLATGVGTLDAAQRLRLSPARVSQLRRELKNAWQAFHGEPAV